MALQNTDLFIVERAGVQYKMTASQIADFVGAVRDYTTADISERDSLSGLSEGDRVFVTDASTESDVDSGWAIYRVSSTSPNVFEKIQEQEGMDIVVTPTNLSIQKDAVSVTVVNDNGTNAVIPLADSANAGLASPAMFNNTHVPAQAGLTTASNPVNVDVGNQEITFRITQLTNLP